MNGDTLLCWLLHFKWLADTFIAQLSAYSHSFVHFKMVVFRGCSDRFRSTGLWCSVASW